jgi:hypothetical protein
MAAADAAEPVPEQDPDPTGCPWAVTSKVFETGRAKFPMQGTTIETLGSSETQRPPPLTLHYALSNYNGI